MYKRAETRQSLSVVVGEPWPDGVEVDVEDLTGIAARAATRARAANRLALGAALLIVVFAVYAMVHHDRALLERIYNLTEWTVLFTLSWIAGHTGSG